MKRSGWHPLLAVVCAMWLVAVLAEPAALHACAKHSAVLGAGHDLKSSEHAHEHGAHSREAPAKHQHGCTCIGACCFAVTTAVAPRADVLTLVVARQSARAIVSDASDFRPSATEYARPPTIGPPLITA